MSDSNAIKPEKKKKLRSKRRSNEPVCIPYDNPDIKVVVRLIPPTLPKADFLRQLEALCPSIEKNLPWDRLFYAQGTRMVRPFEEPKYSRACFLFSSKDTAKKFKQVMLGASFLEPESGDLFLAQTMKPIFGAVAEIPPASTIGEISSDPLFVKFMALRASKVKNIDFKALVAEIRAEERKKKIPETKPKKKPKAVDKKGKATRPSTPKPVAIDTKREETKQKKKRKLKNKAAGGNSGDAKAGNAKTDANPAKETASEASAGPPTEKQKKKKTNKSKAQKQTTGEREGAGTPSATKSKAEKPKPEKLKAEKPKAEKPSEKLSEAEAEGAEEKKKHRTRKRKQKPKTPTPAGPSPPPAQSLVT